MDSEAPRETVTVNRYLILAVMAATCLNVLNAERANAETGEKHLLRYKLQTGDQLNYEVTHVAKTKTRIRGAEELSNVHTVSHRHWDIKTSTADGEATFDHVVDSVQMTQQQGDADEIRWDSTSGQEPPAVFGVVADRIGKVLSTVTVAANGKEIKREDNGGTKASLGMGNLTLTLPEKAIAIGESWSVPREIQTRAEDGTVKQIKIRELYTLEKVQTGVAVISLRSEPLTPIDDESVRAQVVQQLSNGQIRFDIDNGRLLSRQIDWDESVVGFSGANSLMEYRARLTEKLLDGVQRTAKRP
tara:strand:+ start:354568 stop:355473 length:906 start_codon:yes stop_codon:yes gene_type:complete